MPEWATTLLAVAVGAGLTGLVTLVTLRWQLGEERKRRTEDALRDRRERGAAVLGPLRLLLGESDPDEFAFGAGTTWAQERFAELVKRWEGMRESVAVYGAGHPSSRVGEVANELIEATGGAFVNMDWVMVVESGAVGVPHDPWESARESHAKALALAEELARLVREESPEVAVTRGA